MINWHIVRQYVCVCDSFPFGLEFDFVRLGCLGLSFYLALFCFFLLLFSRKRKPPFLFDDKSMTMCLRSVLI